jgi:DNA-binding MurR/RpiR family transcriptional regulator
MKPSNNIHERNDLLTLIDEKNSGFSKGQKLIADFIKNHYDKAAFMTASKIGEAVGVSEATVVRFAVELGYNGYPKLQKVLRELIKNKLTAVQRLEISENRLDENDIIKSVLNSDMEKLKTTLSEVDREAFNTIVDRILSAKRVYILGVRSSAPLAAFLAFYLNLILDDVKLVNTNSFSEMFEQLIGIKKEDIAFSISFPRYSKRTIKATEFIKKQGALTVALTDSIHSPLAKVTDYHLLARSDMASFIDSLVAPLSLINALIVAIGIRRKSVVYDNLNKLEKIWDEYNVYQKSDHISKDIIGEED